MNGEERYLAQSHATGLWGFREQMPLNTQFPEKQLMRGSLPSHLARQWTVSLMAMRYGGIGVLGSGNADNQVFTSSPWQVRVKWATSNASEFAIVDYNPRGCSFSLMASEVSVYLLPNPSGTGAIPPLLSGFLVPAARSGVIGGGPVFTTLPAIITPTQQVTFEVADRAIAYRPAYRDLPLTPSSVTYTQRNGAKVLCQTDMITPIAVGASQEGLLGHKAGYVPLHPACQWVQVQNNDIVSQQVVGIQYLLDLGG